MHNQTGNLCAWMDLKVFLLDKSDFERMNLCCQENFVMYAKVRYLEAGLELSNACMEASLSLEYDVISQVGWMQSNILRTEETRG